MRALAVVRLRVPMLWGSCDCAEEDFSAGFSLDIASPTLIYLSVSAALTCAQFHPDGLIFGTGTMDSQIKIWDLKVGLALGHAGVGQWLLCSAWCPDSML